MPYFPTVPAGASCLRDLELAQFPHHEVRGGELPLLYLWVGNGSHPLRRSSCGRTFVAITDASDDGKEEEKKNPAQYRNPVGREAII